MTRIQKLVRQSFILRGDPDGYRDYSCGVSSCNCCGQAVSTDGQEALGAVADDQGIYFRMKVPCPCGHTVGYVALARAVQPE